MTRTALLALSISLAVSTVFGQDVVTLVPDRAKVEFENAQVRVLRFKEPAGSKLPMHSHPAYVAIGLTNDYSRYTFPDGKSVEEHSKAGSVTFSNAVTHASTDLGNSPSEGIVIELKTDAAGASVSGPGDAATLDPKHVKVELDNNLVRVLRFRVGPHEMVPMHEHPNYVLVSLSDLQMKATLPDGKTEETRSRPGEAKFFGALKHANENLGDQAAEVIVVELKTSAM